MPPPSGPIFLPPSALTGDVYLLKLSGLDGTILAGTRYGDLNEQLSRALVTDGRGTSPTRDGTTILHSGYDRRDPPPVFCDPPPCPLPRPRRYHHFVAHFAGDFFPGPP